MRLNSQNTVVYLSSGLELSLTVPCVPWKKTRQAFVDDEMCGRQTKSNQIRNSLSSAYSWMIRDAVGEALIGQIEAANVGEGFLGEIGMSDLIRANCHKKRPWQMQRAEFAAGAGYFSKYVSPGPGYFVFVEDDPGYMPKEIHVDGSPEEAIRQAHCAVLRLAISNNHPIPSEVLAEYPDLVPTGPGA